MKKLYALTIILLLINVANVFAVADVKYYFNAGTTPITGVQTIGYTCTDSSCSGVTNTPFSYNVNSGSNNYQTLSYPTSLSPNGYAVYYFKSGYVPMGYIATWHGTGSTTYDIGFYKISSCKSPIDSFDVSGSGKVNEEVTLSANVKSAFVNAHIGPEYIIPAYKDEFYSSYIDVTFKVYDSSNNLVYSNKQTVNLYMDTSLDLSAKWTPTSSGTYALYVYTDVTDNQCSSFVQQYSSKQYVIQATQYCGDSYVNGAEQCELPNTNNNQYCGQTTSECSGNKLGTRDAFGYCSGSCGCAYDQYNYQCVKGSCGAQCDATHSCAATECDNNDGCVGRDYYDYSDVANSCSSGCTCSNNQCGSAIISYNDPRCGECSNDNDCNDLDSDYCSGTSVMHDEGKCVNYACTIQTTTTQNCNDGLFCNGIEGCSNAQCVAGTAVSCNDGVSCTTDSCNEQTDSCSHATNNALCNDGLYCNGIETCALTGCQAGTSVDCSANNLCAVATCNNNPDNNAFTWDFRAAFNSVCNEPTDSCTTGSTTITHTCSVNSCGAECDSTHICSLTECDNLDGCNGNDYWDYNDVSNSCLGDCTCSDNSCTDPTISYNDNRCTQCQDDNDCNNLDSDYCNGTSVMHDEGECVNYECIIDTDIVQNCNDGLYCNGQESCSNAQCVAGTAVNCNSNNINSIGTCYNNPDNNAFTWDYFAGFTSACNEAQDSCTTYTGTVEIEHTCSIETCGAECETNNNCDDNNDHTYDTCDIDICVCQHEYISFCGDGNVDYGEECDDGNNINGDGCSAICEKEFILNITSIICFDHIVVDNNQSCSVYVDVNGEPVDSALVKIYFTDGSPFNTCLTNSISGGCETKKIMTQNGTYTVYATAEKEGHINDMDTYPRYTFNVLNKRYDIVNLKVYNDSQFANEDYDFYRAQNMYVSFQVFDLNNNNQPADSIVTKATLVSPPGGRAELDEINGPDQPHYYYYQLTPIPPTHDFLGDSQVFTFAFNFSDNSGGQKQVGLTIRNNPPIIVGTIPDILLNSFEPISFDLSPYEFDIEDHGKDLIWSVSGINASIFKASIENKKLIVHPLNNGQDEIELKLTDLDGDSDAQNIFVNISAALLKKTEAPQKPKPKLQISRIRLGDDEIALRNKEMQSYVHVNNIGEVDLDDLKATIVVPELGLHAAAGHIDVDSDEDVGKLIKMEVGNVQPGNYDVRITISNDKIRRVKHRVITIV